MLVFKRKVGDAVLIGADIEVQVLEITHDGQVSIGFTAPKHINILRKELKEKMEAQGTLVYTEKK